MKKSLKLLGLTALLLIATASITLFFYPEKIIQLTNWTFANNANLDKKSIVVNNYTVNYYQSSTMDKKETMVLLHGMGDDKSSFLQTAKLLSEKYNLILPDLNGHGENSKEANRDYSIKGQIAFLHQFLTVLKVDKFYLAGNSMGGHTALAYTLHYPNEVQSLILINAPGVSLDEHIVYGGFGKPMEGTEDLNKVLSRVFYKVPDLPAPIANYMVETVNKSLDFVDNTLIPAIIKGEDFDLKESIKNIETPTLILWGKHDEVVKMNVAEYFDKNIANSTLVFIENASHSPQLEVPDVVAKETILFLENKK